MWKKQRLRWRVPARSRSGCSTRHGVREIGQRGSYRQPVPRSAKSGTPPAAGQTAVLLADAEVGDAVEQCCGVGVAGALEDFRHRALLDQLAGIHHADPVADLLDHGEVVADEQDGGLSSPRRSWNRSRISAWTVASRAVVGSSSTRSAGIGCQGHRDHDALLHAAGKLVGVERRDAAVRERTLRSISMLLRCRAVGGGEGAVVAEDFRHLLADADGRVEALGFW